MNGARPNPRGRRRNTGQSPMRLTDSILQNPAPGSLAPLP
jgi:hypothetical protein